jgi:uncharacterized protein
LAPNFRKNQFDEGVTEGINAIIGAIGGEFKADENGEEANLTLKEKILIGTFIFGILGVFTILGLFIPGCGGWALYAFLIPFYAIFPTILMGTPERLAVLGTYVIGFPILKLIMGQTSWAKKMATQMATPNRTNGRGWSSGSGWTRGGGGRSSGGFSGGGGSFGGGGSSGSW